MKRNVLLLASALLVVAVRVGAEAPASRYTYPAAGTVYDTRTKLTWQRELPVTYAPVCAGDYREDTTTTRVACTWVDAVTYCATLSLAGGGWRLPTRAELASIIDPMRGMPALDTTVFPAPNYVENVDSHYFWTSTERHTHDGLVWSVDFDHGLTALSGNGQVRHVRCVR
jgi:hypothetical protein